MWSVWATTTWFDTRTHSSTESLYSCMGFYRHGLKPVFRLRHYRRDLGATYAYHGNRRKLKITEATLEELQKTVGYLRRPQIGRIPSKQNTSKPRLEGCLRSNTHQRELRSPRVTPSTPGNQRWLWGFEREVDFSQRRMLNGLIFGAIPSIFHKSCQQPLAFNVEAQRRRCLVVPK